MSLNIAQHTHTGHGTRAQNRVRYNLLSYRWIRSGAMGLRLCASSISWTCLINFFLLFRIRSFSVWQLYVRKQAALLASSPHTHVSETLKTSCWAATTFCLTLIHSTSFSRIKCLTATNCRNGKRSWPQDKRQTRTPSFSAEMSKWIGIMWQLHVAT